MSTIRADRMNGSSGLAITVAVEGRGDHSALMRVPCVVPPIGATTFPSGSRTSPVQAPLYAAPPGSSVNFSRIQRRKNRSHERLSFFTAGKRRESCGCFLV